MRAPMLRGSLVLLLIAVSCSPPKTSAPVETAISRLQRDVRFLASDEMKGRNNATPEGARAAEFVARRMEEVGLAPAGENGTWYQEIPGRNGPRGRNVIGARPGTTPEWIVIGAHFDGLGEVKGQIHNGADDNASGVAVLLEAARTASAGSRGLLFCSFDAEEDGLVGSSHFVKSQLYPVDSFAAMICLDLVGGSFLPGDERRVFALGSESSAALFDWMGRERQRNTTLEVERAGIYAIEPMGTLIARSDYSPFRLRKVPFVFFSTGTPWYYHTPEDDIERLDFKKMEAVADIVIRMARDLSNAPERPAWRTPAPDYAEDAKTLAGSCRRLLEHPAVRLSDRQRGAIAEVLEELKPDGSGGAAVVQKAMIAVFSAAAAQKPAH